jgi:hypothetical protein
VTKALASELRLIELKAPDNCTEVLWGEGSSAVYRILSVPVFAYGVSRGSLLFTEAHGERLAAVRVLESSPGATIRAYVADSTSAHEVYSTIIQPNSTEQQLSLGPATLFDPQIVAVHVRDRSAMLPVRHYFDQLVRQSIIRFWEFGDPVPYPPTEPDGPEDDPWELVHPLPVDGHAAVQVH